MCRFVQCFRLFPQTKRRKTGLTSPFFGSIMAIKGRSFHENIHTDRNRVRSGRRRKSRGIRRKAGFDAWDFSMFAMCDYDWRLGAVRPTTHPLAGENYLAFARKLKQIGLDNGITCNQSHAPFPTSCRRFARISSARLNARQKPAARSASFTRITTNPPQKMPKCILNCCRLRRTAA